MSAQLTAHGAKPRLSAMKLREWRDGWLLASPFVVGFVVWWAGPMLYSLYIVAQDWDLMTPPTFVGLANVEHLFHDPMLGLSLRATAYYTFLGVPLQLLVAIGLALMLNNKLKFLGIYRTIFYLPAMIPAVANALAWTQIFYPTGGLLNTLLGLKVKWLMDPHLARTALVAMSLWGVGPQMVICLAGLQSVPEELHEAAAIDGATRWQRFLHVTLPMLSPVLFFLLIIGIIQSFQVFTVALVMTNGGPMNSTLFTVLYIYTLGFRRYNMGYAAAVAWVLFLMIMVFTGLQFKLANRWVYYEAKVEQ